MSFGSYVDDVYQSIDAISCSQYIDKYLQSKLSSVQITEITAELQQQPDSYLCPDTDQIAIGGSLHAGGASVFYDVVELSTSLYEEYLNGNRTQVLEYVSRTEVTAYYIGQYFNAERYNESGENGYTVPLILTTELSIEA